MTEFDWTSDPCIICEHQPALAVYLNPRGQSVIRQEASWSDENDPYILINAENVMGIAYALLDTLEGSFEITKQVGGGFCEVPRPSRTPFDDWKERRPDIDWEAVAEDWNAFEQAEKGQLALPAPNHAREAVTPDLFARGANAEPR